MKYLTDENLNLLLDFWFMSTGINMEFDRFIFEPLEVITILKSWGSEYIYWEDRNSCLKLLEYLPGMNSSLHYHVEKTEAWLFLGDFEVLTIDKKTSNITLTKYKKFDKLILYPGDIHQVRSCDINICGILEVSTEDNTEDTFRVFKNWFLDEIVNLEYTYRKSN